MCCVVFITGYMTVYARGIDHTITSTMFEQHTKINETIWHQWQRQNCIRVYSFIQ